MADHRWVLDVLDDLREYALKNNIPKLEANIRSAAVSAETEILKVGKKNEPKANSAHSLFGSRRN